MPFISAWVSRVCSWNARQSVLFPWANTWACGTFASCICGHNNLSTTAIKKKLFHRFKRKDLFTCGACMSGCVCQYCCILFITSDFPHCQTLLIIISIIIRLILVTFLPAFFKPIRLCYLFFKCDLLCFSLFLCYIHIIT